MKKIIGIVPQIKNSDNNNPYEDSYSYIFKYIERIKENNAIPIGLFINEDKIDENLLDMCDGFLFPGGKRISKFHFEIIDYALRKNKPILGICLGMQVMAIYGYLYKLLNDRNEVYDIDNIWNLFLKLKEEKFMFLELISIPNNHGYQIMKEEIDINLDNILKQVHTIKIIDNSIMKKIYKSDVVDVVSLHSYTVNQYGDMFIPTAYSSDGRIEAIEYINKDNFIVGVQYHPELNENDLLFKEFIKRN